MIEKRAPMALRGGIESSESSRAAMAGLSLAMLMPSLATSIANAALPTLAQRFGASFPATQWITLAYLLAITTMVVVAGQLGDLVGRRRLLLIGVAIFAASSLLCGLAPSLGLLIMARGGQGVGAAIMMTLTIASVGDVIPRGRIGSTMGLLGTMSATGTALGPSLGGTLIAFAGWPAIFLINVPLAILAFLLIRRALPKDEPTLPADRRRIDGAGIMLLLATLGAYALAMTVDGGRFGLSGFGLLCVALIAGGAFVIVERRTPLPLIQPALFRNPPLRRALLNSALISTVMMTTLVVGPFYLSIVLKLDMATVGLALSAGPLAAALAGMPAGRMVDHFGTGPAAVAALVTMVIGSIALCMAPDSPNIAGYIVPIVVLTVGYATFQAANNSAIMAIAESAQRGIVAGMLNLSRNLGLVSGASAMGAIFAFGASGDIVTARPDAIANGTRIAFAVAAALICLALIMASIDIRRQDKRE